MNCASYVDPIIGTVGDERASFCHGGGKTYPGAVVPGGMVQVSPDTITGGDNGTGYNYANNTIEGFSFNHMSGIGWFGDLGNLQIMPTVGDTDLRSGSNQWTSFKKGTVGWKSAFSHEHESARAGYYSVLLERYGILAEATATTHTGLLRFSYPADTDARVLFNFSRRIGGYADFQKVTIASDTRIEGEIRCTPAGGGFGRGQGEIAYTLYFVCEFSSPFQNARFFSDETMMEQPLTSFEHEDVGLSVCVNSNKPLVLRCGVSYVDLDGARRNLETECPDFDFDRISETAFIHWDEALSAITVEGSDETDKTIFYTCLYHTLLDPRTATDVDGRFAIGNKGILTAEHTQRTMFSGWDVYRSEFPLLTLIRPDVVNDTVCSLTTIADFNNSAYLPRWELAGNDSGCMIGNPALLVIADACVKGIQHFDVDHA